MFSYLKSYTKYKLELKSTTCVILGYAFQHKGYICLEISAGKVIINIHVEFHDSFS